MQEPDKKSTVVSIEEVPKGDLSYQLKFVEKPIEHLLKVTQGFLKYLANERVTPENLKEYMQELEAIQITHQKAQALAIAAYEHAAALGLTNEQRGRWLLNLVVLGCDKKSAKLAFQSGHDLFVSGYANTPHLLADIVARHFHTWYNQPSD